ncbi:MAG: hypothetical protein WBP11_08265 [Dokdonella sp.]
MNTHKGVRLTPYSRALLIERIERYLRSRWLSRRDLEPASLPTEPA